MALTRNRPVNWFEHTSRALQAAAPRLHPRCNQLTERLSSLLLERLPPHIANELVRSLPDEAGGMAQALSRIAQAPADASIGYSTFIEVTAQSLGIGDELSLDFERDTDQVVSTFLWAIMQDFPPDFKSDIARYLPADLKSRMNLYSGMSEQSKVA